MATAAEMGVVVNNSRNAEVNVDEYYQQCCERNTETLWCAATENVFNRMISVNNSTITLNKLEEFEQCLHTSPGEALQHFASEMTSPGTNMEEQPTWRMLSFVPELEQRELGTELQHSHPSDGNWFLQPNHPPQKHKQHASGMLPQEAPPFLQRFMIGSKMANRTRTHPLQQQEVEVLQTAQ